MKPKSWKSTSQAHQSGSQNWIGLTVIKFALVELLSPRLAQTHLTQWLGLLTDQLLLTFQSIQRASPYLCSPQLSPEG